MIINLKCNGFSKHGELFSKTVSERIPVEFKDGGMSIELTVDKTISQKESYKISGNDNCWCITGSDELGLYYGIG